MYRVPELLHLTRSIGTGPKEVLPPCRDGRAAQSAEEVAFDRARRELVFELRGAPADRTCTAEELAELERQRLEVRDDVTFESLQCELHLRQLRVHGMGNCLGLQG